LSCPFKIQSQNPKERPDFESIVDTLEQKICPVYFKEASIADAVIFPREMTQSQKDQEIILQNLSFNIKEKELILGPKIGGGSYGAVYSGKWLGTDVAIKQV